MRTDAKSALLVEVPRGIAADRDTAVRTMAQTRTASRQMMIGFVEINTFIHSTPKQISNEWMHLSPIYTRVHREWLRYAKSTSQYSLAFSLKVRDDWGSQVNPLCCHDITRSDRQIGNLHYGYSASTRILVINIVTSEYLPVVSFV